MSEGTFSDVVAHRVSGIFLSFFICTITAISCIRPLPAGSQWNTKEQFCPARGIINLHRACLSLHSVMISLNIIPAKDADAVSSD